MPTCCSALCVIEVALAGEHQLGNASLALQICHAWLSRTGRLGEQMAMTCYEVFLIDLCGGIMGKGRVIHHCAVFW